MQLGDGLTTVSLSDWQTFRCTVAGEKVTYNETIA